MINIAVEAKVKTHKPCKGVSRNAPTLNILSYQSASPHPEYTVIPKIESVLTVIAAEAGAFFPATTALRATHLH